MSSSRAAVVLSLLGFILFVDVLANPNGGAESFCLYRESGTYGFGCSPFYVVCYDGRTNMHRCEGSLFFDETVLDCVPSTASHTCGTVLGYPPAVVEVPEHYGSCFGLSDGYYAMGCSENYMYCYSGEISYMHCPHYWVYDEVTYQCRKKCEVEICGCHTTTRAPVTKPTTPVPTTTITTTTCAPTTETTPAPTTTTTTCAPTTETTPAPTTTTTTCAPTTETTPAPTTTTTTCAPTTETTTAAPTTTTTTCAPTTETTLAPTTTTTTCAPTTETTTLAPTTTTTTCAPTTETTTPEPTTTTTTCAPTTETTTPAPTTTTTTCAPTTETTTPEPTTETTTLEPTTETTTPEPTTETTTPEPTTETTTPEPTTTTTTCAPTTETTTPEPAIETTTPEPTTTTCAPTTAAPVMKPHPHRRYSCAGKPNKAYGLGCSQDYVVCVHKIPIYMSCPATLVYDEVSGLCMEKHYVAACGGRPTPSAPVTVTLPPYHPPSPLCAHKKNPCHIKPNSVSELGCCEEFVSCSAGVPTYLHCPKGLMYDGVSGQCLGAAHVLSCGGTRTTPRPVVGPPKVPFVKPKHPFCGDTFGVVSKGCSKTYYICLQAMVKVMECPAHHVFDSVGHSCVDKSHRSNC